MTGRPSVLWPVYGSAWAFIALSQAVTLHHWGIVVCAVLAIIGFWGIWVTRSES